MVKRGTCIMCQGPCKRNLCDPCLSKVWTADSTAFHKLIRASKRALEVEEREKIEEETEDEL